MINPLLRPILVVAFLWVCVSLEAQNSSLRIQDWQAHLPYRTSHYATQSDSEVFLASRFGILSVDKQDNSLRRISTTEGLSDVGIEIIKFNQQEEALLIAYNNSNLDIIKDGQTINIRDIERSTLISGSKRINEMTMLNEFVFLSCDFGLVSLDTKREEFDFTTFTNGNPVFGMEEFNGRYYIATGEGILTADPSSDNLLDYGSWQPLDEDLLPLSYFSRAINSFNGHLYFDVDGKVYRLNEDGAIDLFREEQGYSTRFLSSEGQYLIMGFTCDTGCNGRVRYYKDGQFRSSGGSCVNRPTFAMEDNTGAIWYGDEWEGIRRAEDVDKGCGRIEVNSPLTFESSDIFIQDNTVYITDGGVDEAGQFTFNKNGLMIFKEGQWSARNEKTDPELIDLDANQNFERVIIDRFTGNILVGTFWEGLLDFGEDRIELYNDQNSSLRGAVGFEERERITGMAYDDDNNLWITNQLAAEPLSVRRNDGSWMSFRLPCASTNVFDIDVDKNGFKWIVVRGSGVLLFDEGDLDINGDERCRLFTPSNSELPTNTINSIRVDREGDVWVGTNEGAVVFDCGGSAFESICNGSRRIVEANGFFGFLLETEDVLSIGVDGANRKWFGTRNGIFVQSSNGDEEVARYNTSNSPLLDNTVRTIGINQKNGEVWLGTDKGMITLRAEATEADRVHSSSVYAFPNPVRPEYDGLIAIRGLAEDANVKITDMRGRLVFETRSLGGQAVWDGKDYNGREASSGVYLVYSTGGDAFSGSDSYVTKILIVK